VIAVSAHSEPAPDLMSSLPTSSQPPAPGITSPAPRSTSPAQTPSLVRTGPSYRSTGDDSDRQLVWALAGLLALILIGGAVTVAVIVWPSPSESDDVTISPSQPTESSGSTVAGSRVLIPEGYAIQLPDGFVPLDRTAVDGGDIVYTFYSESDKSSGGEFRISPDRNSTADSSAPVVFAQPPENFKAPIVQINGQYYFPKSRTELVNIGGMSAVLHRIDFSIEDSGKTRSSEGWFVHAMDDGRVLTMRLITTEKMPLRDWHASVTSIQKVAAPRMEDVPTEFQ